LKEAIHLITAVKMVVVVVVEMVAASR